MTAQLKCKRTLSRQQRRLCFRGTHGPPVAEQKMVGRGDVDGPAVALDSFGIPLGHEVLVAPSVAKGKG